VTYRLPGFEFQVLHSHRECRWFLCPYWVMLPFGPGRFSVVLVLPIKLLGGSMAVLDIVYCACFDSGFWPRGLQTKNVFLRGKVFFNTFYESGRWMRSRLMGNAASSSGQFRGILDLLECSERGGLATNLAFGELSESTLTDSATTWAFLCTQDWWFPSLLDWRRFCPSLYVRLLKVSTPLIV
jgi:hypothetical protein